MKQFNKDYALGKKSELDSLKDIEQILDTKLTQSQNQFDHFDYESEYIFVELKTRPNIVFKDDKFYCTSRNGNTSLIETLWFDKIKLNHAKKNKTKDNNFYVFWKLQNCYCYYNIDIDAEEDYYVRHQYADRGKGYKQHTDVVYVFTDTMTIIPFKN